MKLESSEDQSVIFAMITTSSIGLIISLLVVIVLAINLWLRSHQRRQTWTFATSSPFVNQDEKTPLIHDRGNTVSQRNENEKNGKTAQDEAPKIVPLPDFNWKTTEPLKFRPFKPRYHITMGIAPFSLPLSPSPWGCTLMFAYLGNIFPLTLTLTYVEIRSTPKQHPLRSHYYRQQLPLPNPVPTRDLVAACR